LYSVRVSVRCGLSIDCIKPVAILLAMSFPNPDNYARDCDCGTAGANTTPPPATIQAEINALRVSPFTFSNGGAITMTNVVGYPSGSINMSGSSYGDGGSINTSGGNLDSGGSIDTSNQGGSINTTGTGSIGFGIAATRTTLNGSATAARTVTLPNITGTLPIALISTSTALDFGSISTGGFVDLTITLTGAATTDVVFVACLDTAGRGATDGKLIFEAFVSATNTVTVRAHNPTAGSIDPASYNFKVAIIKTA